MKITKKNFSILPLEESHIPTKDECIQKALDSLVFVREVLEQALKTSESSKPSDNNDFKKDCHNCFDANCPDKEMYDWEGCTFWKPISNPS